MSHFPIIVLEGPDGVGKTTLANKLCEVLDGKYVHLTYRFKDRMQLYHSAALSYALKVAETRPVVVDRWWPSEVVYADAYRGGTKWPLMGRHLERVAMSHGVSYVFCLPEDRGRYLRHFNELKGRRAEMYDEGLDRVYDGFVKQLMAMSKVGRPGVVTYDMFEQGHNLDAVVQEVLETTEDYRSTVPWFGVRARHNVASGNLASARYLLVNLSLAPRRRGFRPFVTYEPGWYLRFTQALESAGVSEVDLAFADLHCHDNQELCDKVLLECARHMKVVALGEAAAEKARHVVPLHDVIQHPWMWTNPVDEDVGNLWRM